MSETYDEEILRKYNDKYLCSVAEELKTNCEYEKKYRNNLEEDVKLVNWNFTEIDYDINKCNNWCAYIHWDYNDCSYYLCDSCKSIIDEKIRKPFNKPKSKTCQILEEIELKKQLQSIMERLEKLEADHAK
jgi:hypothetical protein